MKKRLLLGMVLVMGLLLSACGTKEPVSEEEALPKEAIEPVLKEGSRKEKETVIHLTDFDLVIPDGYVYGFQEYKDSGYKVYYVWMDDPEKKYITQTDKDVMLYILDGLDAKSIHQEITESEARTSFNNAYINYFRNLTDAKLSVDSSLSYSNNDKYYAMCFTGYSGDYFATTYGTYCYPKSYYGIYTLEQKTDDHSRQYYGFIFSNDDEGELFTKNEYTDLLNQIKSASHISEFYSATKHMLNPDPADDVSNGRSYEQMLKLFENTYLYYVETLDKPYERENVDSPSDADASTEELVPLDSKPADELEPLETVPESGDGNA